MNRYRVILRQTEHWETTLEVEADSWNEAMDIGRERIEDAGTRTCIDNDTTWYDAELIEEK